MFQLFNYRVLWFDNKDIITKILLCWDLGSDIGSDIGYIAVKGYDPVTGLGTLNVTKMIQWLDDNIN